MALIQKSEIRISLGTGSSLRDAKILVVYLTAIHQDFFGRLRMADNCMDEEKERLNRRIQDLENDKANLRQRQGMSRLMLKS